MERTNKQSGELLKWLFDFRQLNKQQKFDTVTTTKSSVTEFCELTFISKLFFYHAKPASSSHSKTHFLSECVLHAKLSNFISVSMLS